MNYWLVKSEPNVFSWQQFLIDKIAVWDGVRNYKARNNVRSMKLNDKVLFYHSNIGKEIVGVAHVSKEFYQDPTDNTETWSVVELIPDLAFNNPISLTEIKIDEELKNMELLKYSRLSVISVSKNHFETILKRGDTQVL